MSAIFLNTATDVGIYLACFFPFPLSTVAIKWNVSFGFKIKPMEYKKYIPGSFVNASLDKASDENERLILNMDADNGNKIAFVQIAGLVARRIICDVDIGHSLKAGEVFGLIRFGSRVDIYFPSEVSVMVLKGQKMIAGETIIGDFSKNAKPVKEITDEK